MIQQAKAKIFLADQRGISETDQFQSRHTFNYGSYFNGHKHAFGNIYLLNDDTLAGAGAVKMTSKEPSYILLIPVVGAIAYKTAGGGCQLVTAGQVQLIIAEEGTSIEVRNPFKEDPVNFLQVWIRADKTITENSLYIATYPDVNEHINTLVNVFPGEINNQLPFSVSIGKFIGRGETSYRVANKKGCVFVFVIEGAFETVGRLMHARDGLALWDTDAAEMEALSNDAIIMTIELPYLISA